MKSYKDYVKYATRLASRWRHSAQKIKEKLMLKGASPTQIERIISSLTKDGIVNDKKSFDIDVFVMEEKRYGYRRVREYLLTKGYSRTLVDTYIFNKDIEVDKCKFHFLRGINKYRNYKYSDIEREKLINYLKRCGFNDKIIYEVIRLGINYENVM